jgi:hypothetical protein
MRTMLIGWLGTMTSVVGLVVTLWPTDGMSHWTRFWLVASLVLMLWMFVADLRHHWRSRPRAYKTKEAINDYMFGWISRGGRVVIFTRDMTWATERRISALLLKKARAGELSVCLPSPIPFSEELRNAGAEVSTYRELGYVPTSRFTIINADRLGAQIAIARPTDGVHIIEEFNEGDHPVFAVAKDLVEIVRKLSR